MFSFFCFVFVVPFIAPPNISYQCNDYQSAYVSWEFIPSSQVPGILRGYDITYREYFSNVTSNMRVAADMLQRTVTGLKANTLYWLEVAGYTNAGLGPESLVVFKTPPGRKYISIIKGGECNVIKNSIAQIFRFSNYKPLFSRDFTYPLDPLVCVNGGTKNM